MIDIRKAADRGETRIGWLDSKHTFSFGRYVDRAHMGFRALRVINEDRVAPGAGFPTHGHQNMEIVTIVVDGALAHRDSLGNGDVLKPGDVQRMSAGSGIEHSEFNASDETPAHFLQIWIEPQVDGGPAEYTQKHFDDGDARGRFRALVEAAPANGALSIRQDAALYDARLGAGESATHAVDAGRHAWVQAVSGAVTVNGVQLEAGDGAAVSDVDEVRVRATSDAHVLLFDLA